MWAKVCRDFIRENAAVKGRPNMTHPHLHKIKSGLSKSTLANGISNNTARMWLHHLGCTFKGQGKDVYYDGHEREDVVEYRNKEFLPRLQQYEDDPDTVVSYQDEVVFRSHEMQNMYWHLPEDASSGEPVNVVLRKKGGGKGMMVSGFVTREQGFSFLTDQELGVTFEFGKGSKGYWTAEHVVKQVAEITSVLEFKFPNKKIVFIFDWSSNHDKKAQDAILLHKMGVKWGGKAPKMRST
ncbi:unnamed protein product, partial [Heterosigma akashiwo]